jgi:hypothetical protein
VVEDCSDHKSDESPDSTETSDPAPRRVVGDQLSPKHRRAERNDCEDQYSDVLATLARWCQLGGRGEGGKFVDSGTDSRKHHTTNEDIHGVSRGADDHANYDAGRTDQCHPSATDKIRDGAGEWAYGCETEQVREYEPDPTVSAT